MKNNYPYIKGFTKRNIERMVQFYSTYKDDEIATPLETQFMLWVAKNEVIIMIIKNTSGIMLEEIICKDIQILGVKVDRKSNSWFCIVNFFYEKKGNPKFLVNIYYERKK